MTYGKFAYLYDKLMEDVPYDNWVNLVQSSFNKYHMEGKNFLDLACGTGELSVRFAEAGYNVTGADISSDMLAVAKGKMDKMNHQVLFVEQDMTQLDLLEVYDGIGIFLDSLNYLQSEKDVIDTFQGVFKHLKKEGLFIFDVHSLFKMNEVFSNQTFAYNGEDISYIWQCFEGDHINSVEHELTFFELEKESGQYKRYDELHYQQTFSISQYEEWLVKVGFQILEVYGDLPETSPTVSSERIFFIAKKI